MSNESERQKERKSGNLNLYIKGPSFRRDRADLSQTISVLTEYNTAVGSCLEIAAVEQGFDFKIQRPQIQIKSFNSGSIDVNFATDAIAAVTPFLPEIVDKGWTLFASAMDLIEAMISNQRPGGQPVTLKITDSPGATVVVNAGSGSASVTTPRDTYEAAVKIHDNLDKLANPVKDGRADFVKLGYGDPATETMRTIDADNKNHFKVTRSRFLEPGPITFDAAIYQFNRKIKTGKLQLLGDRNERRLFPFSATEELVGDCIDALKLPFSRITAQKEVEISTLGEKSIKRFILQTVSNEMAKVATGS